MLLLLSPWLHSVSLETTISSAITKESRPGSRNPQLGYPSLELVEKLGIAELRPISDLDQTQCMLHYARNGGERITKMTEHSKPPPQKPNMVMQKEPSVCVCVRSHLRERSCVWMDRYPGDGERDTVEWMKFGFVCTYVCVFGGGAFILCLFDPNCQLGSTSGNHHPPPD